jgi:hypothetical protein
MNAVFGWLLALAALAAGWRGYGWQGLALAFSVIVFWLLIMFNRSVRVMRMAAESPVGVVGSAVMLNAKLTVGVPMLQVVAFTKSIGQRVAEEPDTWEWRDASGSDVTIVFEKGRCKRWTLNRPTARTEDEATASVRSSAKLNG